MSLSTKEAAIYDRQIRLWGVEAQQRLRGTSVLVLGVCGLSAEVLKNIVLSGVGHVALADARIVQRAHLAANFLLAADSVGRDSLAAAAQARLAELNPLVRLSTLDVPADLAGSVASALSDDTLRQFQVVLATELPLAALAALDARCRALRVALIGAATHGYFGYAWCDANGHEYRETTAELAKPAPKKSPSAATQSAAAATIVSLDDDDGDVDGAIDVRTAEPTDVAPRKRQTTEPARETAAVAAAAAPTPVAPAAPAEVTRVGHVACRSLEEALCVPRRPADRPDEQLVYAVRLLHAFHAANGRWPAPDSADDAALLDAAWPSLGWVPEQAERRARDAAFLTQFVQSAGAELSPVCAILGGILGQEIIKLASGKDEPLSNFLSFNALKNTFLVDAL